MTVSFNEKLIAYLTLISGLAISTVAVYYSVVGLTAIFSAAAASIIIMGVALEISKLVATVWLKQNWSIAPISVRIYLLMAITVLMLITSMGIFGFLSKSHSDQSLVSGEVVSRLQVIDQKILTSKENIESARKQLKQLDDAVDQVMSRTTSESGADKSNAIRRSQQKERTRLNAEIAAEQKLIAQLNEEASPIRSQVRKVEAEVGPLKYIAALIYGETDQTILEKAVTWVILLIVLVFDPLAVILLLASQISFQSFRQRNEEQIKPDPWIADVGEKPTENELKDIEEIKYEPDDGPLTDSQIQQVQESVNYTKEDLLKAYELKERLKHSGVAREGGIVKVDGTVYLSTEFDRLLNIPVNIEENNITQEEYFKAIKEQKEK